jgi:hypothetical protein
MIEVTLCKSQQTKIRIRVQISVHMNNVIGPMRDGPTFTVYDWQYRDLIVQVSSVDCKSQPISQISVRHWQSIIHTSDPGWTEYDSDRCAAFPACCCAGSRVRQSLPDLWQSAGVRSSLPVSLSRTNTLATGVRRSLFVAAQGQVCEYPCLFLWKCACDSALALVEAWLW